MKNNNKKEFDKKSSFKHAAILFLFLVSTSVASKFVGDVLDEMDTPDSKQDKASITVKSNNHEQHSLSRIQLSPS